MSVHELSDDDLSKVTPVATFGHAVATTARRVEQLVEAVQRISETVRQIQEMTNATRDFAISTAPGIDHPLLLQIPLPRRSGPPTSSNAEIAALSATIQASSESISAAIRAITETVQSAAGTSTAVRNVIDSKGGPQADAPGCDGPSAQPGSAREAAAETADTPAPVLQSDPGSGLTWLARPPVDVEAMLTLGERPSVVDTLHLYDMSDCPTMTMPFRRPLRGR